MVDGVLSLKYQMLAAAHLAKPTIPTVFAANLIRNVGRCIVNDGPLLGFIPRSHFVELMHWLGPFPPFGVVDGVLALYDFVFAVRRITQPAKPIEQFADLKDFSGLICNENSRIDFAPGFQRLESFHIAPIPAATVYGQSVRSRGSL